MSHYAMFEKCPFWTHKPRCDRVDSANPFKLRAEVGADGRAHDDQGEEGERR